MGTMGNATKKGTPLLLVRSDAKMRAGYCSVLVLAVLLGAGHSTVQYSTVQYSTVLAVLLGTGHQAEAARSCGGIHCAPTRPAQQAPCRGSLKAYRVRSGGSVYNFQFIFGSFRQHPPKKGAEIESLE